MSRWLQPLRAALDEAAAPVAIFFRDDDAGWGDGRLFALLDAFAFAGAPIDLAAIPCAISAPLARALAARQRRAPERIRIHQHGYAHENHEPSGRRCEFGPSRPADLQRADIRDGRRLLAERLDVELDPIFTPPWNRCTAATARAVREAGLTVLSRESRADPLGVAGVRELPVSVDWLRHRGGVPLARAELGAALAAATRGGSPVGVMLHHAVMDAGDVLAVSELLALLTSSAAVRLTTIAELARTEVPA